MIGRHVLTRRALRDLETIWDDTEERWGHHQAEDYIRQLWRHIELVAHLLFYRRSPDGIVLVRILHERMDFIRHI